MDAILTANIVDYPRCTTVIVKGRGKLPFHKAQLIIDYLFSLRTRPSKTDYPLSIGFYVRIIQRQNDIINNSLFLVDNKGMILLRGDFIKKESLHRKYLKIFRTYLFE